MAATLAMSVVLLTAACGQKGPLTLTPPSKAKAGSDKAAPASNLTQASAPSAKPSGRAASAP
jgi:predicted small lipoprotein YifL